MNSPAGKYFNLALSLGSYAFSVCSGKVLMSGMPAALGIELTNNCNLRCAECPSGSGLLKRPRGFIDPILFEKIIAEMRPFMFNVNLYFQGESMMHPKFFELIGLCRGLRTTLSTNGHFLDGNNASKLAGSGISKLIISLDGFDSESYSKYRRGGDFEKVVSGIIETGKVIRESGSKMRLEIQMLVNRNNESQISEIKSFARSNNAVLRLKSIQVVNNENFEYWIPRKNKYSRYTKHNGQYRLKSRLNNRCLRMWVNPVVTWDGNVVPCCFDKDAAYVMGSLKSNSFSEIWYGEKYMKFRRMILKSRKDTDICCNCTSGVRKSIF